MQLWSDAFRNEEQIPLKYAKDGKEISPPLSWTDLPEQTRELALIFEDMTPQTQEPQAHWIVYEIPPDRDGLAEGFRHKSDPKEPLDVLQGTNDLGNVGYDGPLGTAGRMFRFRFRVFALEAALDAPPKASKDELLKAISGRVLDEAELTCLYERPPAE